jgi:hypothetical protein
VAYQVVEKESFGTDWQLVRYYDRALARFDTEEKALQAAKDYITDRNCNNPLTKESKLDAVELFMMSKEGVFLGNLDGKPWYLTYPKDMKDKSGEVKHAKGDIVHEKTFPGLENKTEVMVRTLPGS